MLKRKTNMLWHAPPWSGTLALLMLVMRGLLVSATKLDAQSSKPA